MADIYTKISFQHPSRPNDEDQFWDSYVEKLYQFPFTGFEEDKQLIGYITFSDFQASKEGIISYCKQHAICKIEQIKGRTGMKNGKSIIMVVVDDFLPLLPHFMNNQIKYSIKSILRLRCHLGPVTTRHLHDDSTYE